jgi:branched-chain amino acid transport system substrate-binding protein
LLTKRDQNYFVIPAGAGTHDKLQQVWFSDCTPNYSALGPSPVAGSDIKKHVVLGPGLRRDDEGRGWCANLPLWGISSIRCAVWVAAAAMLVLGAAAAVAADPIKIAVALPLSGPRASLGAEIRAAIEMTLADAKARTGGQLPVFDISWHDDGCSSTGGAAVANALVAIPDLNQRPAIVIGHACPSAAASAAVIYGAAGVPYLAAGTLPGRGPITQRFGVRHFRMDGAGTQGALIGATLAAAPPDARIAFVRDRTLMHQSTLQAAGVVLAGKARTVALVETFPGAEKDFAALAQRVKAANITHIALAAFPSEAALLALELRRAVPDAAIVATDTLADPAFARSAGSAADGIRVATAPDAAAFPRATDLARRLAAGGTAPSRSALASAAALEIVLAAAVSTALSLPEPLSAALANGSFETVLGPVGFDETGAARLPSHVLYTWRGGVLVAPQ